MQVTTTILDFSVRNDGTIEQITWKKDHCPITHKFLTEIDRFDTGSFIKHHNELPKEINITFIGYWKKNGEYCRRIF